MGTSFPQGQPLLTETTSLLTRWLARFGFRLDPEKPINLAVMETRKMERRVMRREASVQAEKPPLPFA